jgi:hypothetical protein
MVQESKMNLEDGTDRFSRNASKKFTLLACNNPEDAVLSHFAAEARNHAGLFQMFLKFARNMCASNLGRLGEDSNLASIIPHLLRIWRPRSKLTHTKYTYNVVWQIP